jgi:anti-sigma factor RsiW
MKPETLETLLLDRTLGEFSPPVTALLDEHLARDPAAARQAAVLAETLQLAHRAVAGTGRSSPRPLPDGQWLHRAAWQARWRKNLLGLAQLAACLVLGIFLGRAVRPEPAVPAEPRPSVIVPAPASLAAAGSQTKFWSLASRAAEQRGGSVRSRGRDGGDPLLWESPFKLPRGEGKP